MSLLRSNRFAFAGFLAVIAGVPVADVAVDLRAGRRPPVADFLAQPPTQPNLRAVERAMEEGSAVACAVRPWVQAARFLALGDAGEKVLRGRGGWLFYRPGADFLTQRPAAGDPTAEDALAAVRGFRDELAARGIRLIVVPVPNKESVYPDRLSRNSARPSGIPSIRSRAFLAGCERAGIEAVDLFAEFRRAREAGAPDLYLATDSHWTPAGLRISAAAVAKRLGAAAGPAAFAVQSAPVRRNGDLVRMLRSPPIEAHAGDETVACERVVRADSGAPYADDPSSDVLVMGDSFLRIYETDEPGGAGFVAHLARALGRPVASLVNDGGGATLVRQDLVRRVRLLERKKVVVWEFVERDLRFAAEGWPVLGLPDVPRRIE
jgi:hypothetical protein